MINELKKNIKKKYSYSVYTENKVKKYFTLLKKILKKKIIFLRYRINTPKLKSTFFI